MSSLTVEKLSKNFGTVNAVDDISLAVRQGEMLALVGPSGCGKTTCLRCIAGLERPTAGRVLIGDRVVTAIEQGIFLPPEKREIGMVFQSYAIWPHMTVFENVAYPLRAMGVNRAEIIERVMATLKLVRLEGLQDRYSSQISGGQQQRVALARSLVAEPKLLLFDEPLSNLDANLRLQMRIEIKELQNKLGFTAVYVTHDQAEAMVIADRIAVLDRGKLRQLASPREIYERPATRFIAGFMGSTNLIAAKVEERRDGMIMVGLDGGIRGRVADVATQSLDGGVHLSVRPEAITLSPQAPSGGNANVWPAKVSLATYVGNSIIYLVDVGPHRIEVHTRPTDRFEVGANVFVAVEPEQCILLNS